MPEVFMKLFVTFLTFSLLFVISPFSANAKFIIEERDEALNRTIFAPNNNQIPDEEEKEDLSVNNKASSSEMLLVDVEEAGTSVSLLAGQFIAVRLVEPSNTFWTFEKNFDNLVFIKKEKRNDIVILLYQTIKAGDVKLIFDLMKENRALLSRILNVKVI